jgi:hypothetical protein
MAVIVNTSTSSESKSNVEINISCGNIGVLSLSGVYKSKETVAKLLSAWNERGIRAEIVRNSAGRGLGYQIRTNSEHPLVAFLNLFEGNTRAVAEIEQQVRAVREFKVVDSRVTDTALDSI